MPFSFSYIVSLPLSIQFLLLLLHGHSLSLLQYQGYWHLHFIHTSSIHTHIVQFTHPRHNSIYVAPFHSCFLHPPTIFIVVVSINSLDPCLWGESDHPDFGTRASISLHLTSSSITPAGSVRKSRGDSVVHMWVQLKPWCVSVLQRGHSVDGCHLASTLYDLRKGDLFDLSWARVQQVRRGSLSSELLMCGGGVRSILPLSLVVRFLETIDVCIWHIFIFMSAIVTVGMPDVQRPLLKIVGFLNERVIQNGS